MPNPIYCTSCDAVIPSVGAGKVRRKDALEYLTGPVEFNTIKRYFLQSVPRSELEDVLREIDNRRIPLCDFCMEMVTRIYDFENEIDLIKSLIDSMVTCLKYKIVSSCAKKSPGYSDGSSLHKLRTLLAGREAFEADDDFPIEGPPTTGSQNDDESLLQQVQKTFKRIQLGNILQDTDEEPKNSKISPSKTPVKSTPPLDSGTVPIDSEFENRRKSSRVKIPPHKNADFVKTEEVFPVHGEIKTELDTKLENDEEDFAADDIEIDFAHNDWDEDESVEESDEDEDEEDEEDSEDETSGKKKGVRGSQKGRGVKREPGELPKWKRRKTDRINRKVTKLGNDCYEFKGFRYSKTEAGSYKCESCDHVLKTRDSALTHVKLSHLGEGFGNFLCSICGKSFRRNCNYVTHLAIHSDLKRHQCDICGRAFKQQANLWSHKKIHEGELNFVCEYQGCGKKFLRKKQLTSHFMRHIGERPHMCELCGKSFVAKGELTKHLRTHAGIQIRRFECDMCDKKFITRYHLNRHKKSVHKAVDENKIEQLPREDGTEVILSSVKDDSNRAVEIQAEEVVVSTTVPAQNEMGQFLTSETFLIHF